MSDAFIACPASVCTAFWFSKTKRAREQESKRGREEERKREREKERKREREKERKREREKEREKERKREREKESKRAREQESKRAREQESKRAREQESKRAREQESKRGREEERKRGHPTVVDEGDELARRFIIRASAREALEEHAAVEAIRRAAATRSQPMKTFEPGTVCFFLQTLPRRTSGNGNARTISGTRGFDWTSRSK